ncbi:hypothetical protein F2Q68_00041345 [Brassica cretica]|uniref:EDS1 EP domain-containing protein n=1 Tax=Brassica cretica TaxID=69181 RepID=A0A8S9MQ45_BRACR|nr:hypothetical protein F2Q68_00041345 [Brassica cretica]
MEEYRFEKNEIQASFMMSTPLWSESWSLCNAADCVGNIQIQHVAGIMYVALPKVEMNQPGNLVGVEVAGDGLFAALSSSLLSGEPPFMVNDVILELFVSTGLLIQSQYTYSRTTGHYMKSGNRPKRYEVIDKWWKARGEPHKEKRARTRYASTTQDTWFWAKLEEAKECLDDLTCESSDAQKQTLLWKKIYEFERYSATLVKMKEVSKDVLATNSSYTVWVEKLREFNKLKVSNGVVDKSDAMET